MILFQLFQRAMPQQINKKKIKQIHMTNRILMTDSSIIINKKHLFIGFIYLYKAKSFFWFLLSTHTKTRTQKLVSTSHAFS